MLIQLILTPQPQQSSHSQIKTDTKHSILLLSQVKWAHLQEIARIVQLHIQRKQEQLQKVKMSRRASFFARQHPGTRLETVFMHT